MTYQIIEDCNRAELQEKVDKLLKEGWRPAGGVYCSPYQPPFFLQAMTREEKGIMCG